MSNGSVIRVSIEDSPDKEDNLLSSVKKIKKSEDVKDEEGSKSDSLGFEVDPNFLANLNRNMELG